MGFGGTRVNLTVEYLWDLPLTNVKGEDLDHIAIELQEKLSTNEKSFVVQQSKTKETQVNQLKFDIVKHIIDVKLQEQEERIVAAEKKAKRQKILDLMAKKQDAELESKSYEELAKELEALS